MIRFYRIRYLIFLLLFVSINAAQEYVTTIDSARHAMVVAAREEAVQAGLEMLKLGGNAVDAAVAAAFMIGVVEPYASGLGGGGGMLIYLRESNQFYYIDYYHQAPARIDTTFSSNSDRETGRAICIPGTPAGLTAAVQRFGRLPLKTVMQPAIETARGGFVVNQVFFKAVIEKLDLLITYPETAGSYLNEGLPYMAGDTLKLPQLAAVLEGIAERGSDYFYR